MDNMKQNTPVMEKTPIKSVLDWISNNQTYQTAMIDANDLCGYLYELLEQEKQMVVDAYFEGFKQSAEGYNYEYPFSDNGQLDQQIKNDIGCDQYYTTKYNQLK